MEEDSVRGEHPFIQRTSGKAKKAKPTYLIYCMAPSGRMLLLVSFKPKVRWTEQEDLALVFHDQERARHCTMLLSDANKAFADAKPITPIEWELLHT